MPREVILHTPGTWSKGLVPLMGRTQSLHHLYSGGAEGEGKHGSVTMCGDQASGGREGKGAGGGGGVYHGMSLSPFVACARGRRV